MKLQDPLPRGESLIRLVLDRSEIGGAVIDVDVLDRAMIRRNPGLKIHKIFLSIREREGCVDPGAPQNIQYHPVPYVKDRLERDLPAIIDRLSGTFHKVCDVASPKLFVNHVPEHQSGHLLAYEAQRRGLPVISIFHGGARPASAYDDEHARSMETVVRNLEASAGLSDAMAAVSSSASELLRFVRVTNLGTGCDPTVFSPSRGDSDWLRKRIGLRTPVPIVLLPARVVPEKGHLLLLESAGHLFDRKVDHRLVFAGSLEPPKRVELEWFLRANGRAGLVHVLYDLSPEEMIHAFRGADVVVLPGFHMEGCPRVLIEAGLMERAIVATDSGGTREAFQAGQSGELVPVGDAIRLADALERLLRDPALRREMGRRGRQFAVERFNLERLAERHERLYFETVAKLKRASA